MKLIPLKCEFCGGRLKRVSSDTVMCHFCQTGYLVHGEPKEPIAIPVEEPQIEVAIHDNEDEPCEAEQEIRRLMAENEYKFWQSLPAEPEVKKARGKLRIVQPDNLFVVPFAFGFISLGIGSVIVSGVRNVVLYWIAGICFVIGSFLGVRAVVALLRVSLLLDQYVKQQTAYRKQIQDLHGHRELLARLP